MEDKNKTIAVEIAKGFSVNARFRLVTNDFEGRHQRMLNFEEFKDALCSSFDRHKIYKPQSCRKESKEIYIIGLGKKGLGKEQEEY